MTAYASLLFLAVLVTGLIGAWIVRKYAGLLYLTFAFVAVILWFNIIVWISSSTLATWLKHESAVSGTFFITMTLIVPVYLVRNKSVAFTGWVVAACSLAATLLVIASLIYSDMRAL